MVRKPVIYPYDIEIPELAEETLILQKASYKIEAELLNYPSLPPLHENVEALMSSGESFIGHFENAVLNGAVSYKVSLGTIDIHRLIVHPEHFRKGIARKLLNFLRLFCGEAERIIVSTGAGNQPAVQLYLNYGFNKTGQTTLADGLQIIRFEKKLK